MTVSDVPALRDRAENKSKTPENLAFYLDPQRYLSHLDTLDISENQKLELLKTLWLIMGSFVDRAFGDDPVQQARKHVGEITTNSDRPVTSMVSSEEEIHQNKEDLSSAFRQRVHPIPGREEIHK